MTEAFDISLLNIAIEGNYALQPAAGPSGVKTATASGTQNGGNAHLLALRPASGAAGPAQVFYIYSDHLNTPRAITNEANTTIWKWDNVDPFGNNAANEDPDGDTNKFVFNLRFPGQYADRETGTHYNYFRDYDPAVGRYIESDPIGLDGGINTYLYAYDPLTQIDPFGLMGRGPAGNSKGGSAARDPNRADCGPEGGFLRPFVPNNPLGFPFLPCCNAHDKCYDNCLVPSKLDCDMQGCGCFFGKCKTYAGYVQGACQWAAQQYCYQITYSRTANEQFLKARAKCSGMCKP